MSRRSLQTERRRETTAYHEAGHVVAMCRQLLPIRSVTIVRDRQAGSAGGVHGVPFHPGGRGLRTLDRLEKEIIVAFAGPIAQRKRTGRSDRVGALKDLGRVADLAFRRFGERLEVGNAAGELAQVVHAYLHYLELLTTRNVARWWPAIEVVAAALLERETLSGRQVRGILREAGWRELSRAHVTGP